MFRNPIVSVAGKFLARITYGGLWGLALGDYPLDVRLPFMGVLALIALWLSTSFFGGVSWFNKPVGERMVGKLALLGLYVAGEVLCVGAVVLMALAAFLAHPSLAYAAATAAFGGHLACLYALAGILRISRLERK